MKIDTHVVLEHDDFKSEETFDELLKELGITEKIDEVMSITLRVISVETSDY